MHLESIRIKNLLSFEDSVFPFTKYDVIVGPNNSGKTNLLRILSMIAKGPLNYLRLAQESKLNPDKPTVIKIKMKLDEREAPMVFQCVFGENVPSNQIQEQAKDLEVTIFWSHAEQNSLAPIIVLYAFGNGFTIAVKEGEHIAFDSNLTSQHEEIYKKIINWDTADGNVDFRKFAGVANSEAFGALGSKRDFIELATSSIFSLRSFQPKFITLLPLSIKHDANSTTPIDRIAAEHSGGSGSLIPLGHLICWIFAQSYVQVSEIHPAYQKLSEDLANLRNQQPEKYSELCGVFKKVSGHVDVMIKQGTDKKERILFVENGKEYEINDSASGYYSLTCILYALLSKSVSLVAVDEPELHFHPLMVSRLHETLRRMVEHQGNQLIIATHSTKFVTLDLFDNEDARLIVVSRPDLSSQVRASTGVPRIKPNLFRPEIFFGKGSMLVEGISDYSAVKALSDFHDGLLEKNNINLIDCGGVKSIPTFIDLHDKFGIPYHAMADKEYDGALDNVTVLPDDLEAELRAIGVKKVPTHAGVETYDLVMEFLCKGGAQKMNGSNIGQALKTSILTAGGKTLF